MPLSSFSSSIVKHSVERKEKKCDRHLNLGPLLFTILPLFWISLNNQSLISALCLCQTTVTVYPAVNCLYANAWLLAIPELNVEEGKQILDANNWRRLVLVSIISFLFFECISGRMWYLNANSCVSLLILVFYGSRCIKK